MNPNQSVINVYIILTAAHSDCLCVFSVFFSPEPVKCLFLSPCWSLGLEQCNKQKCLAVIYSFIYKKKSWFIQVRCCQKWRRVGGALIPCSWSRTRPVSPVWLRRSWVPLLHFTETDSDKRSDVATTSFFQSAASLKPLSMEWPPSHCANCSLKNPTSRHLAVNHRSYSIEFPEFVRRTFLLSAPTVIHFHWWIESNDPVAGMLSFPLYPFQLRNMLALTNTSTQAPLKCLKGFFSIHSLIVTSYKTR